LSSAVDDGSDGRHAPANRRPRVAGENESARDIPELVSALYGEAPTALRVQLVEQLVRPLGPLALAVIATGAFRHLLYRLRRDAAPISPNDVGRITSEQVLELTRYVQQCSPDALLQIGALIADGPVGAMTMSGTALLIALGLEQHRYWS
jgi:hypothetical protein